MSLKRFAVTLLSVVVMSVGLVEASAVTAPPKVWSYADRAGGERLVVDVVSTSLDVKERGFYRVRVFGREFIKNDTDMIRLFFDADPENNGPDFYLDWYFGRNPAEKVGTTYLGAIDSWPLDGDVRVRCPRVRHSVNYATDIITVLVPRSCLGRPDDVRWAGFTGSIDRLEDGSMYGDWDDFPKRASFPGAWVA